MAAKQLIFDEQARQALLKGVRRNSRAPSWQRSARRKAATWSSTKNSVPRRSPRTAWTVAKEIELEDPYDNMGAQMVREVASKTSDAAGDGTTTATVLAEAIYREGLKYVTSGASPIENPARGINKSGRRGS